MIIRSLGSALHGTCYGSPCREMLLLALTHNIAIILFLKELLYRAYRTPLISYPASLACGDRFYSQKQKSANKEERNREQL